MRKTWCENCNKMVECKEIKDVKLYDRVYDIHYNGIKCECLECGKEVHINEIDHLNMQKAQEVYDKKDNSKKSIYKR